jgi:hypothetical protein
MPSRQIDRQGDALVATQDESKLYGSRGERVYRESICLDQDFVALSIIEQGQERISIRL